MNIIEEKMTNTRELQKSQEVRFLDMALFGPMMIMSAMNKEPAEWMRLAMLGIGIGTVIYNANNYFRNLQNVPKK